MTPLPLALALLASAQEVAQDRPGDAMPDRHWDMTHLALDLTLDPLGGEVRGTAQHTVQPIGNRASFLRLHAVALDIGEVRVDGEVVPDIRQAAQHLDIPMPESGDRHTVEVDYTATPETGLHFRGGPGSSDPVVEVWSQGEDEDNRYWFPGWDHPSDTFSVTQTWTAPANLVVAANGVLTEREANGSQVRWTFEQEQPIVNYLVAVVAGEYRVVTAEVDNGGDTPLPLQYIGAKSWSEDQLSRGLDEVRQQVPYFNELLGHPYPYPIYRQALVARFMYGGMENATLTILADTLIVENEGDPDLRTREVVAHELAHQWFGDLLTTYGWRDLWLNEGFATFYTGRWMEHSVGPSYYAHKVDGWFRGAIRSEGEPMAPRGWSYQDSDNNAVYVRGASVLHMLRRLLGDEVYDEAVRTYVRQNTHRLVETDDLRRILEDASGMHLGWFFDQWVHQGGIPSIQSDWSWNEGQLVVTLRQTTEGHPFAGPVSIEIGHTEADSSLHTVWVGAEDARLVLPVDAMPDWVGVNAQADMLAKWDMIQEDSAWQAQLAHSAHPYARLQAARMLGKADASASNVAALAAVLDDESADDQLRARAAESLGELADEASTSALLRRIDDPSFTVQNSVVSALGEGDEAAGAVQPLTRLVRSSDQPRIRSTALGALSELSTGRGTALAREVLGKRDPSAQMEVHRSALWILGSEGNRQDLAILLDRTQARWPGRVRTAAAWSLTNLMDNEDEGWVDNQRDRVSKRLLESLNDPDIRMRETVISVLGQVGDADAADALRRFAKTNEVASPDLSQYARDAARMIGRREWEGDDETDPAAEQEAELDAVRERLSDLEERLRRLEEWR